MRYCVFLLAVLAASGQESKTYVYDVNGDPSLYTETLRSRTRNDKTMVERIPSMNGETALDEKVDERVIESSSTSRIVERITTYGSGERAKVRTEEKKRPDGGVTTSTTRYQDDGNGSLVVAERSVEQSRDGMSETVIERPTIDGSLVVVEKKSGTTRQVDSGRETTVVTYRQDTNGNFDEAVREISLVTKTNGVTSETTDQYLAGQLNGRTVTTVTEQDGKLVRETSIYGMNAPGKATSDRPQLREQTLVERNKVPGGTVETFSVRRPSLDDTPQLGQFQLVSTTVCTGCGK